MIQQSSLSSLASRLLLGWLSQKGALRDVNDCVRSTLFVASIRSASEARLWAKQVAAAAANQAEAQSIIGEDIVCVLYVSRDSSSKRDTFSPVSLANIGQLVGWICWSAFNWSLLIIGKELAECREGKKGRMKADGFGGCSPQVCERLKSATSGLDFVLFGLDWMMRICVCCCFVCRLSLVEI